MPETSATKKPRGRPKGSKNKKTLEKETATVSRADPEKKKMDAPPLRAPGDVPAVPKPKRARKPRDADGPLSGHLGHKAPVSDFTNYIFSNKFD